MQFAVLILVKVLLESNCSKACRQLDVCIAKSKLELLKVISTLDLLTNS